MCEYICSICPRFVKYMFVSAKETVVNDRN